MGFQIVKQKCVTKQVCEGIKNQIWDFLDFQIQVENVLCLH